MGNPLAGLKFKQMRPFRRDMQIVFQDPYGSLSPRMSISDIIEEGLWVHHPKLTKAERDARVVRALRDVGLDPESRHRFPHEYLRRPAPAHRGRPRHRAGADLHRARRADERARYADPGPDGRPFARPAEAAQSHLSVHLARPACGCGAGEPSHRDAARQGGGGGARRGAFRQSQERLYPRACSRPRSSSRRRPRASSP